jgi:PAS domain S-box-containing protein
MSLDLSMHSDQRFRALIEHSCDVFALLTLEATVTYASPSSERVIGYPAAELLGKNCFTLLHPEDLEYVRPLFTALLDRPGQTIPFEGRMRHTDGTWRWMEGTLSNLLDDAPVGAVVCNFRDISARKQAQDRLRQSEEAARAACEAAHDRLQDLCMQAPAAMAILRGPEHRFEFANLRALQHRDRTDIGGKTIGEVLPELVTQGVVALLDEVYATGTPFVGTEFPVQVDHRGGGVQKEVYYTFLYQPTRDAQGEIDGVGIHSVEVTEQVQARQRVEVLNRQLEAEKNVQRQAKLEAQARASELEAIFEAMTEGVSAYDAQGELRYTNTAYRSLLALEENADASVLLLDRRIEWQAMRDLGGRLLAKEQLPLMRVLRGERFSGPQSMNAMCRTHKGADLILNVSGAPIRDASGQVIGGVAVFRDETEQHRLVQQLQGSESKLRMLVESNIFGFWVIDDAGHIYEVNDRLVQMLGYSREELLCGKLHWQQLTPPDYQEKMDQSSQIILTTGSLVPYEKEYLRKDGSRLPVLVGGAIIDHEKEIGLGVMLDISDRRELERRKQEFLSMVSHELRSPLTAILGLIELALMQIELRPRSLTEEAEALIARIAQVLERASGQVEIESRIVEELLDVSRMERHTFELVIQRENLVAIVEEVVANQQQTAPTRRIELTVIDPSCEAQESAR